MLLLASAHTDTWKAVQYGKQVVQGVGRLSSPKLPQHASVAERTGGRLGSLDLVNCRVAGWNMHALMSYSGSVHVTMVLAELRRFCRWLRL